MSGSHVAQAHQRIAPPLTQRTLPFWISGAGDRIGPGGDLPLNTNGPRQLPRQPQVAVVSSGTASFTSALLLTH